MEKIQYRPIGVIHTPHRRDGEAPIQPSRAAGARGTIRIDERYRAGLRDLDLAAWRAGIAWVPQRPHLFSGSLAENVALGAPGASVEGIGAAVEAAPGSGDLERAAHAVWWLGVDPPTSEDARSGEGEE